MKQGRFLKLRAHRTRYACGVAVPLEEATEAKPPCDLKKLIKIYVMMKLLLKNRYF